MLQKSDSVKMPTMTALEATHLLKACNLYKKKAERDYDPTYVPPAGKKNSQLAKQEVMESVIRKISSAIKKTGSMPSED